MAVTSLAPLLNDQPLARSQWFQVLAQCSADLVLVLDEGGVVEFASPSALSILGLWPADLVGSPLTDFVHPEDRCSAGQLLAGWIDEADSPESVTFRLSGQRVRWVEVECSAVNLLHHPVMHGLVVTARDVSERGHSRRSLEESHSRFVLAARGATDGLWEWDLSDDQIQFSQQWAELIGLSQDDITTSPEEWFRRVHPEDVQHLQAQLAAHLDAKTPSLETDFRILHADGGYRWMMCRGLAVRDRDGRPERLAGALIDISHRMLVDGLTGLPNRSFLVDRVKDSIERARRDDTHRFAVLSVDLDRFKVVNDSLGHEAGDRLLIAVARRLATCVRPGDTCARLSADEFAVLLDGLDAEKEAERIGHRIQQAIAQPVFVGTNEVWCSASLGIASSRRGYESPEAILREANTALTRAKKSGFNKTATFQTQMLEETVHRFQLESDLRRALQTCDDFSVRYQPIIDLSDGTVSGFEALVRWQHEERGWVSPAEFIPVAEEAGVVAVIDRWVLENAAEEALKWQNADKPIQLSVNVSSKQFALEGLVEHVTRVLEETGLDPTCLKLEVTESAVMDRPEAAERILAELKSMGIRLALDDFGTGYSSLSYLHRFPFDELKIDRSFVMRMGGDGQDPEFVSTMLALADSLGMATVAEGIETDLQRQLLCDMGARYGQGYFFARPLTPEDAESLVNSRKKW